MLEGEIRDIDLVARLVELWREPFTGAIRFENDGIIKIIYFKSGDVLSASTNDRSDSVDEILMRAGKVSREHVKQALAKRKENETLGDTLLNLGFITRKELTWARRVQVVGVIRSITDWKAGSYTIVADYLPKRDEGTIFSLPQIIVELVVTDQDRPKFEKLLESGSVVFSKAPGFDETFSKLGFNEDAEAVVKEVDGERTAAEVAASSGHDTFNTYKLLQALSLLGLLTRSTPAAAAMSVAPSLDAAAGTFEGVGVADAADAWNSAPMPKFDLADDTGPGQVTTPLGSPPPPVVAPEPPPAPGPAAEPVPPPVPAQMPAWDVAPRAASPPVAPAPEPPADVSEEPRWGFDEAQIETARKASVPVSAATKPAPVATPRTRDYSMSTTRRPVPRKTIQKKKKSSRLGLVVALLAIMIVAAGGYFGFNWWTARNARQATATVTPRPHPKLNVPAGATTTMPMPAVETSSAPPKTASAAPPRVATPTTAPVTPAAVPRPVAAAPKAAAATAATGDRARYDAMAREFAAAPGAQFTVQFEIVCEPSNVTKALNIGGRNVWFIPISLKGRSCYRVFWGRYPTRDAAERATNEVPASLREAKPTAVQVPQP